MKKKILLLILLFSITILSALELTPDEKIWIENHPVIRIAPDPKFPPIEWFDENGEYKGIAAEFMDLISERTGISFKVIQCENWNEVLTKARNREVDLLPAAAQTPKRAEYMNFSEPHLIFSGVIITTAKNKKLSDIEKLREHNIGIVSGYVWHEFFINDHPDIEVIPVENIIEGLRKVSTEEIDAFIGTLPIVLYYIEKEGIHNLVVAGETGYTTRLSIQTRRDWPILNNIINKSLNDISKQEREEIIHKWIHIEPMSLFANKVFWRIVVIMLMIGFAYIVIFILWNMSLKKKVKQRTKELEEDIAKRIVIEKALSKSEENFKMIVENQVDLLVKVDENGRFIFVSPSYCKMFGKSKEELIGKSFTPLVHPEDLEKTQIEMKNLYSRPYTCYIEQRAKTQFGWRWLAWKDKAVLDANGKVKEIIGLGRDITDRKEAELENLKLAEIIRYMKDGIILTDPEGKIEFVNSAFEEMSGYKLADIMFMDPIEFVVTDNPKKQAAKIRSSMKKIESWSGEMICRRANGEEYFIETQIFPIFDENNRLDSIAAIQRDITEKKEIEAKLNAQQEKLENAVMKRTAELRNKNKELEEMNKIFVGREFRIKKLKEKLKELEEKVKILD